MPESKSPTDQATEQARPDDEQVLLMLVVASPAVLDDLLTVMLDVGIGGTLVDSKGLAAHLREEMPIFSGLASLLPQTTGSRMVFSIARRSQAGQVLDYIENEMKHAQRPLGIIVDLERVTGVRT